MIAALIVLFVAGILLFVAAAVAVGLVVAAAAIAMKLLPLLLVGWLVMRVLGSRGQIGPRIRVSRPRYDHPHASGGISAEDAAWLDSRS